MQVSTSANDQPSFNPTSDANHLRIDATAYNDLYIIGDVHGCLIELEKLVERVRQENTLFILVGDFVSKGPDTQAVIEYIHKHENMLSVRGNNEQKLIKHPSNEPNLTDWHREYLESLPVAISWEDTLVVHGGVDPRLPLDRHAPQNLMTMRLIASPDDHSSPYWFEHYQGPPRVFFGHTVLKEPYESQWAVGLDTGCVYGGQLTAYHYNTRKVVTVDAEQTYEFRALENFISPPQTAEYRSVIKHDTQRPQ